MIHLMCQVNQNTDPTGIEEVDMVPPTPSPNKPAANGRAKKPKPAPAWKSEKNVRNKLMVSHQEIEAKGTAVRAEKPNAPLLVYFHCPYCDHARELSPNDITKPAAQKLFPNGMSDVRCAPVGTRQGSIPVDQMLWHQKSKLCMFVAWGKMRTHILECLFLVRWANNPEMAKAARADPIVAEEHLPGVFRSMARKYSVKDTIDAAAGKINYKFYKKAAQESKEKKAKAAAATTVTLDAAEDAAEVPPAVSNDGKDADTGSSLQDENNKEENDRNDPLSGVASMEDGADEQRVFYKGRPSKLDFHKILMKLETVVFQAGQYSLNNTPYREEGLLKYFVRNGIPGRDKLDKTELRKLEEHVRFANVNLSHLNSARNTNLNLSAEILPDKEIIPILEYFGFESSDIADSWYQPEGKKAGFPSRSLAQLRVFIRESEYWNASGRRTSMKTGDDDRSKYFSLRLWGATSPEDLPTYYVDELPTSDSAIAAASATASVLEHTSPAKDIERTDIESISSHRLSVIQSPAIVSRTANNTTDAEESKGKDNEPRRVSFEGSEVARKGPARKKKLQEQKEELEHQIAFLLSLMKTDPTVKVKYDARMKKYDSVANELLELMEMDGPVE